MAAMPNDIAASQEEALNTPAAALAAAVQAETATETKPKKAQAKKPRATTAGNETAEAAETESQGAQPQKQTEPAAAKKDRTPWYVARTERQLRARENQSIVYLTTKLVLQSHHAQDVLARTGKSWSEAMITLSETMRNYKPEDQCIVVDAEVDRLMDECVKAIQANGVRLNKMAEQHGIDMDGVEIEYTKPEEYQLRILSPREFKFHNLLKELDSLCALLDKLWLLKLVPDRHRSQIPFETKRQIMRLVNRVRTLVYRAQASSQRAGARDATDPRIGTVLDPNAGNPPAAAASEKTDDLAEVQEDTALDNQEVAAEAA